MYTGFFVYVECLCFDGVGVKSLSFSAFGGALDDPHQTPSNYGYVSYSYNTGFLSGWILGQMREHVFQM
jgi:hypothetical protein